jgi:DNA polymerase
MFVGEGPGLTEAKTGRPFCGAAGKVLDELLESIGIERKSVYITNVIKDRPPHNRDPNLEEIKACAPFLLWQIEIVKPKVICPLGNYANVFLLTEFGLTDKIEGISRIHGKIFKAKAGYGEIKIISMYHPAVIVYNINMKNTLKDDFKILKQYETAQKKTD